MSGIVGKNAGRSSGSVGTVAAAALADDSVDSDNYVDGSIDNAHIADDAIDSEHYATGSIDEGHIADNAVTLAKMAGGTDGNIISFDTSGNPVAIATGNDGQILTSSGANTQPAFEDAPGGGKILQVVNTTTTAVATTTGTIPFDDTIPQSGEGGEFLTRAITPANSSNSLIITFNGFTTVNPSAWMTTALFQDTTAGALAAKTELFYGATWGGGVTLIHYMAAGTTSSTTFKIRMGLTGGTTTLNGQGAGRLFGGVCSSSLTVMEIAA